MSLLTPQKMLNGTLITIHWVFSRGAAFAALIIWAWYYGSSLNPILESLQNFFLGLTQQLGLPPLIRYAIELSKPELMVVFIALVAIMYWVFSPILIPVRTGIFSRTLAMIFLQLVAFIALFATAYYAQNVFEWFFDKTNILKDWLLYFMSSYSDVQGVEQLRTFVNISKPYHVFALVLMAVFIYGGWRLVKLPFSRGED